MSTFRRSGVTALASLAAFVAAAFFANAAFAAVTPATNDDPGATTLANSILADSSQLVSAHFDAVADAVASDVPGHESDDPNGPAAVGDAALDDFPTAGSDFGILTTGDPLLADQTNSDDGSGRANNGTGDTPSPGTSDNSRGDTDFDTTILRMNVTVPAGANCVAMDYRFLTEEFDEYVGQQYNDAFIAEIDNSTWTDSGSVISAPGDFATKTGTAGVSVNGVGPIAMSFAEAGGTTYDGSTGLVTTKTTITPGAHTIFLSIFDQGDHVLDSAAFVDNLRFITEDPSTCKPPEVAQAPPPPPPPSIAPAAPPSNQIAGSSIKFKNGATILTVVVPGPGTVSAGQATSTASASRADAAKKRKKHKKPVLIKRTSVVATAAGPVSLTIKPTKAGKKLLKKRGKFTVKTAITFAPNGGTPATTFKNVTIKIKKKHHHKKH
jgi:hypothetical protein